MDCKCTALFGKVSDEFVEVDFNKIDFCPLHAAASEMFLCLKLIRVSMNSVRDNFPNSFAAIEQAIAIAEGEKSGE